MLKTIFLVSTGLIIFFHLSNLALASSSTDIQISGNGQGSHSTVTVDNSGSATSQTDIKVETNGVVKEYHGTAANVHLESNGGNNSVTINNSGSPLPTVIQSPSTSPTATPLASITSVPSAHHFSLFEAIKSFFDNLFK